MRAAVMHSFSERFSKYVILLLFITQNEVACHSECIVRRHYSPFGDLTPDAFVILEYPSRHHQATCTLRNQLLELLQGNTWPNRCVQPFNKVRYGRRP